MADKANGAIFCRGATRPKGSINDPSELRSAFGMGEAKKVVPKQGHDPAWGTAPAKEPLLAPPSPLLSCPVFLLALSCLQGRPKRHAADELLGLGDAIDGLQLTPGNPPDAAFDAWVQRTDVPLRTHHGYCEQALRRRVWGSDGRCLVSSTSVHAPLQKGNDAIDAQRWRQRIETEGSEALLETMHPGYLLASDAEFHWAMDLGLRLAVDVSHLFILKTQGLLQDKTLRRLFDYPLIPEIHLSDNNGKHDLHLPIRPQTFGLSWAQERCLQSEDVDLVLECYMHRMTEEQRQAQVAIALGTAP